MKKIAFYQPRLDIPFAQILAKSILETGKTKQ